MRLATRIPVALKNTFVLSCLTVFLYACEEAPIVDTSNRAEEVTDRIVSLLKEHEVGEVTFASSSYDPASDEVTITEFKAAPPAGEDGKLEVEQIVITGPKTPEDGTFSADSIILTTGYVEGKDDQKLTFNKVTEIEVYMPTKAMADAQGDVVTYTLVREMIVEDMMISPDPELPISRIHYSRGALDDNIPQSISIKIEGMEIKAEEIDDPDARAAITDLGYEMLNLDVALDWQWDSASSGSEIGPIKVTVANAGGYELTTSLGGITRELLTAKDSEEAMELAQQITLKSLLLQYTDDSATGRALALAARKIGVSEEDVVALWLNQVRQGLAEAEMPESFNEMVMTAMQKFLADPKNLSISINPPQPIPAAQIMGSVMFGPAALIPLLNIKVSAN